MKRRSFCTVLCTALFLIAPMASAQVMPPPHKAPRTPVNRQTLDNEKPALHSRDIKGPATVIDSEHLQVAGVDLRLFGIVPPQLSASFGPQARAALDEITQGQNVECHVRDRDHDGRFLATCVTENTKTDPALELLKRGLAVAARGSVQPTDLAVPYETAERAAETQKIGLWSVAPPSPATVPAVSPPAAVAANSNVPPLPSELKKEEKSAPSVKAPVSVAPPVAEKTAAALPPPVIISAASDDTGAGVAGFFTRYQLIFTGLVILATALGISFVLAIERRRDRRDEMKAIAAALRGELLAARAVCQARLKVWTEADERGTAWPRIRATLYQAYVGKLGWLGAVLARQIASIYGQATDYAVYFSPASGAAEPRAAISKRQALQTLVQHIEEVLPKLAVVEQTGARPRGGSVAKSTSVVVAQQDTGGVYAPPRTTVAAMLAAPLRNLMRKFARAPQTETRSVAEEAIADYTTMIEEEIARMSAEEESTTPPNVTRIRG